MKIFKSRHPLSLLLLVVLVLGLPSSTVRSASTLILPGETIHPTIAASEYLTASSGSCYWHGGGVGNTVCESAWLRSFRINGSGFRFNMWTDTHRRGFLQIWVDGVQYHNLSFNYYGTRSPEVTGLTPGIHEVTIRVDWTTCADPDDEDNCNDYGSTGRPDSYYFNTFLVYGPGDLTPPTNPASAIETHGAVNGVWQNFVDMPEFTWPAGTDADSGVAGYEVYFGADPNGTSTDFQAGTTYTTTSSYADGTYYLRLRTQDNAENFAPWVSLFTFNYDGTLPNIALNRTGTAGTGGWWTSPLDLSAVITDNLSGVASSSMSIDGGAPQPVADLNFSTDGVYQVVYAAADHAGNIANVTENVWIDQTLPVPYYDITTTGLGENGWYVRDVVIAPNSTDATSGIAADQVEVDGSGTWNNSAHLTTSGVYSILQRVVDNAGNTALAGPKTMRIDLERPVQAVVQAPSQGQVVSNSVMDFVGNSADALSGLQSVEFQIDGGAWQSAIMTGGGGWEFQIDSESLENGLRTIVIRAKDMAGNAETWSVQVDVQNAEPVPDAAPVLGFFIRPTATPMPSPTVAPTQVVAVEEEEAAAPAAAPVVVFTPTAMPTATPFIEPVVHEVKKPDPVNISVGISILPVLALMSAAMLLYDPRPSQINHFIKVGQQVVPDTQGLKELMTFVAAHSLTEIQKRSNDHEN